MAHDVRASSLALVIAVALVSSGSIAVGEPPATEQRPVTDTLHGRSIVDPYRWLEGSDAPELAAPDAALDTGLDTGLDAEVAAWTDAQNAYTRSVLEAAPGRAALEARLRGLMEIDQIRAPEMQADRYFVWRRGGTQAQWGVEVRETPAGPGRLLIDPVAIDPSGLTSLEWIEPSPDASLLAFGLQRAGDENTTLHVLDVGEGSWLADEIPGKVEGVVWLPEGRSFVYSRLAAAGDPYSRRVELHRLGTHEREDALLIAQLTEGPLATTWGPFAAPTRDGRWLLMGYWTGTDAHDLWVADFDRYRRTGELVRREAMVGERATAFGTALGDTLYLRTTLGAPNGRVVAVDLHRPEAEHWRELIPERPDAVVSGLSLARGLLVVQLMVAGSTRLERYALDGSPLGDLPLPGLGSASVVAEPDRTEAFLTFESWDAPPTVFRVDLASGEREVWSRVEVPVDPSQIEVRQVFYPSPDGTRVPMFLVMKKGLPRDGERPTVLTGYGGFGLSETPEFVATLYPWLEAGGIWADANLRGGGELGESWHRAGMLDQKQKVFDDFIAAAEWLAREGWTRPARLGISGGSNGGLLTGAALVQRPELFGAVHSAVPLLDMLRYQHFLMARFWVPEYGSAEDPTQLAFLHAYSPYHHVEDGVRYPPVLLTAGENDSRVHPLHARKMAARLQAATASDPATAPVLLWVDREAGHGQGKPLALRLRDVTDKWAFFGRFLGARLDGGQPGR